MGFKLITRVYEEIKDTTPTAQAILAFLAHRADDANGRCYPSHDTISAATHFCTATVKKALKELQEKQVLDWTSGGRKKGGRALANDYRFNFPRKITTAATNSSSHDTAPAVATTQPLQGLPDSHCSSHQIAPIISRSELDQPSHQPSVVGGGEDSDLKRIMEIGSREVAKSMSGTKSEAEDINQRMQVSVVEEAMRVSGAKANDTETRRMFTNTLIWRNKEDCLEVIRTYESELRQGENGGRDKRKVLNHRLAALPKCS